VRSLVADHGVLPPVRTQSACAHQASVHMGENVSQVLVASSKHLVDAISWVAIRNVVTLCASKGIATVLRTDVLTLGFVMPSAPKTLVDVAAYLVAIQTEMLSALMGSAVNAQTATVQLMACACQVPTQEQ